MNERVVGLVATAFGLGEPTAPAAFVERGAMGEIFQVTTTAGRWAVKALFDWDSSPPRPLDVDVQLLAREAGLRLPAPILTSEGHAVIDLEHKRFRAYEWADLLPPERRPSPTTKAYEAGSILGTIHSLDIPCVDAIDPWYTEPPPPWRWDAIIDRAGSLGGALWSRSLRDLRPRLVDLGGSVDTTQRVVAPIVCHRDFDPSNVIPDEENRRLVTLDWENAGPLAADSELAMSLLAWTTDAGEADPVAVDSMLDGYASTGDRSAADLTRASFDVAITTFVNFVAVLADQAIEASEHTAFAEQTLGHLLGRVDSFQRGIDSVADVLGL